LNLKGQASFRWIDQNRELAEAFRGKSETAMTTPLEEASSRKSADETLVLFLRDEAPAIEAKHKEARKELERKNSSDSQQRKRHVLLSYNWDHQELAKKVRAELGRRGFEVWFDIEQIHGSTLAAMAEAVENSAAVLVCMSQKYQESQNCRLEAEYSLQQTKPIIPLVFQEKWRPSGWLGMLLGAKMYFDFTTGDFNARIDEVAKELERHVNAGPITGAASVSGETKQREDGKKWTAEKVQEWLKANGASAAVVDKFAAADMDGVALWELWMLRKEGYPDYHVLLRELGFDKTGALLRFTSSLRTLFS